MFLSDARVRITLVLLIYFCSIWTTSSGAKQKPLQSSFQWPAHIDLTTATVRELNEALNKHEITSVQLVLECHKRILQDNLDGYQLHAVIEIAPLESLIRQARHADNLRSGGIVLGPLHGIPILVKDNIATDPELGMNTTAGSYALLPIHAGTVRKGAPIIAKLRAQGAIILGKTNMSEFGDYRGKLSSGWSGRGGQTQSPYVLGGPKVNGGNPGSSSSGSASVVAAGWASISIGTDTDGSITLPASRHALYSLKPSLGLVSQAGMIGISHHQDSAGPMGKSAWDVAALLGGMTLTAIDFENPYTIEASKYAKANYLPYLTTSFTDVTLGIPNPEVFFNANYTGSRQMVAEAYAAIAKMSSLGANILNNTDVPNLSSILAGTNETMVLNYDFKHELNTYLSTLTPPPESSPFKVSSLSDIIRFNEQYADLEFTPESPAQQIFYEAEATTYPNTSEYKTALYFSHEYLGRKNGIGAVFAKYPQLKALVVPADGCITSVAAIAGYPIATVPLGYHDDSGAPFGLAFVGRLYDEPGLISLMSAYEVNFPKRRVPEYRRGKVEVRKESKIACRYRY